MNMRNALISTAVATALVCGPLVTAAFAANPAGMAPKAAPTSASLQWPVCDKTHKDHCIELGWYKRLDRETNRVYPQCAKIHGRTAKASCIEAAFKTQEQKHS